MQNKAFPIPLSPLSMVLCTYQCIAPPSPSRAVGGGGALDYNLTDSFSQWVNGSKKVQVLHVTQYKWLMSNPHLTPTLGLAAG